MPDNSVTRWLLLRHFAKKKVVASLLAAQHGKHVFLEKPIANTIADGKKTSKDLS